MFKIIFHSSKSDGLLTDHLWKQKQLWIL